MEVIKCRASDPDRAGPSENLVRISGFLALYDGSFQYSVLMVTQIGLLLHDLH